MKTPPDSSDPIHDADTMLFAESPTMATISDETCKLSLFNLPTELDGSRQSELIKPARNPLTDAPVNSLYNITHKIGVGGYGIVWYGMQAKLKRRVALKSLKIDTNGRQYEQMSHLFRQEALTTAYLQHPNVVPVYDLTEDHKNRPMVAMKLVEGRQWNRVLAEDFEKYSPLEFLEYHIPVLISIAQAVAFAHSKGIIHRDLKPSQVMIGNYGEVLLMDWGLAMAARDADGQIFCDPAIILDAQSPLLNPLSPAGTPGYMAPEQTYKDPSKIGPWTDVYLMGAILYELLTGYRPHSGSTNEDDPFQEARLNKIIKAESCTPDRDIPPQLSTLAHKAMAIRPSQRISSASAFANELKQYLEKASRRGESMALVTEVANAVIKEEEHTYDKLQINMDKLDQALAQWSDNQMASYLRHQLLVTFARTALANHDLKFARLQADRLNDCHERTDILRDITIAQNLFNTQEIRMNKANSQARAERERAETLVHFLLLDLQEELSNAGRSDLVYKVATEALQFFDSLQDDETSTETLYKRCIAFQQIGTVLAEHGRRTEAETSYNRAHELASSLTQLAPETEKWQNLKIECLALLGKLHYSMGRLELAGTELQNSLHLRQKLHSNSASHSINRQNIAYNLNDLALVYWRESKFDKAKQLIEESLEFARDIYILKSSDAQCQSDLATFLSTLSNIDREMGNVKEALQNAYEALSLRIALSEQFPAVTTRTEDVYWARSSIGLLHLIAGDYDAALENLKHDLSVRRRLFEENITSVPRSFGITFQLSIMAEVNFLKGKIDETDRLISECLIHSKQLAQTDESNPTAVSRYSFHLIQKAELLASRQEWKSAEQTAQLAVEKSRYSYWLSPRNFVVFQPVVQSLAIAARLARRNGNIKGADQMLTEGRDILSNISSRRCPPEYQALIARLQLDTADQDENIILLKSLKIKNRLDPYLKQWGKELGLI